MANKNAKGTQQQEKVIESVSKTEQFYNENKKLIWGCLIGIVVIGLAILGYRKFIYEPKAQEAAAQMYPAEASFINGEFQVALDGDGNNLGFRDIISEYGTKAGKAVYLYAGLSALNLQQYDEAIKYLKKYKGKDPILNSRAFLALGDCYEGLGDTASAFANWDKATKFDEKMLFNASTLLKMGITYEELGQPDKALECYKKIEDKYPQSIEAYDIAKYITRIETAR